MFWKKVLKLPDFFRYGVSSRYGSDFSDMADNNRLPSAACAATPLFDVRSSGLFCYHTTFEIRRVLLTVFVVTWKLFFSRSTIIHGALGASRLCAIQIYYWHWHWHWRHI